MEFYFARETTSSEVLAKCILMFADVWVIYLTKEPKVLG
jgi:hypothetical protein